MAKQLWIGLDVGLDTTSLCVLAATGDVIHEAVVPTNAKQVHREIVSLGCRRFGRIALESGVGAGLARDLKTLGYAVELYEARQLSKFLRMRRNKTDAGDALGIAHAGRIASSVLSRVHLKSLECQSLGSRLTIRRHLNRARTNAVNLICRQFDPFCVRLVPGNPGTFAARAEQAIVKTFGRKPNALASDLRHLLAYVEELRSHKSLIDRELKKIALDNDVCRRLMDIPGVGPICALTFYAAVDEPQRFRKATDIGPYLGLTPKILQSGSMFRSGRISRMGHAVTRGLLVQSSVRFMRSSDPRSALKAWAGAIEARAGKCKSRVALARKLATIMIAMWKRGTTFELKLAETAH